MSGLVLRDIRLSLPLADGGERFLLHIESLSVSAGESVVVMGPSGSGKSSLLSYICGVLSGAFRVAGRVFLAGEDITDLPTHRRGCGIMFQSPLLFPHLTVAENLAFGLSASVARSARRAMVAEALATAGLSGYGDSYEHVLSGGEKARIGLLRVLLSCPRVLLLDEPFSSLDAPLRHSFREFTMQEASRRGLPILLVTHDGADAAAFGGRVLEIGGEV